MIAINSLIFILIHHLNQLRGNLSCKSFFLAEQCYFMNNNNKLKITPPPSPLTPDAVLQIKEGSQYEKSGLYYHQMISYISSLVILAHQSYKYCQLGLRKIRTVREIIKSKSISTLQLIENSIFISAYSVLLWLLLLISYTM